MKKCLMIFMMLLASTSIFAQAEIKFESVTHNFGTFPEKDGTKTCTFTFTNVGDQPLVINQAVASCGCTVPTYTKKPVLPGEKGEINIKYNGGGRYPGHFKKTITIRTNGKKEMVRLYIEGEMTE